MSDAPAGDAAAPTTFTYAGAKRGFVAVQPLALGVFVYGVTFGLLALGSGLSTLEAMLLSAGVYSGSAQTVAVGAIAGGSALVATLVSVLLLNARYLFYGASMRSWLAPHGVARAYGSLFFLGDGNWLLAMRARANGERDAAYLLGTGVAMFIAWLAGTALAGAIGAFLPPPAVLGLDFLLVAFCAAMAVDAARHARNATTAVVAVVAAAVAIAVDRFVSPGWAVVAAGLAGVAVGAWRQGGARKAPA